ncbi:hypothetical protein E4U43_001024 [Claviceps pusilla]|uniref:Uncharacterized protein n=1 Tax=Claviceps pusilla TaxID=123648 RepID=A0A9P7N8S1_9HYPO|nr:hypothetical protein E4U43_001024 [Claviceps pusilla]
MEEEGQKAKTKMDNHGSLCTENKTMLQEETGPHAATSAWHWGRSQSAAVDTDDLALAGLTGLTSLTDTPALLSTHTGATSRDCYDMSCWAPRAPRARARSRSRWERILRSEL